MADIDRVSGSSTYRRDIDGLRAVAIVAVVAFHAFPSLAPGGFVGVDVFFVISGYLITGIIARAIEARSFSMVEFYARRIKRIFPALCTVLAACLAFGYFALLPDELAQMSKHIVAGAGFVSNLAFWQETGYFDNAAETKPLLHLWSLGIEEQFYLLWPLVILAASLGGRRRALLIVGLIGTVSFVANVGSVGDYPVAAFFSPLTRFWELLIGAAIALGRTDLAPVARNVASLAGAVLVAAAVALFHPTREYPGWLALVPTAGTALLIVAGPQAAFNRAVLAAPAAVWLGLISYPLYLWHWSILSFERIILSAHPPTSARMAAVAAALVLAWLTYRWIERPIRRMPRGVALKLGGSLATIAVCSGAVWALGGLDQRPAIGATLKNQRQLIRTAEVDAKCFAFLGRTPIFPYCRFNDAAAPETVALIGDSHAHALFPGLAEALSSRGKNLVLLANSGCPPLIGATTGATARERRECALRIDDLLKAVHDKPEIREIYLVIRGEAYVKESGRVLQGSGPAPALFTSSLQSTMSLLGRDGRRLYFVSDNPEVDFDPVACIDRPFRPARPRCVVKLRDVRAAQQIYWSLIDAIPGLTVLDALPALCDGTDCPIVDNGVLLYADSHHLSVEGSRRLARSLLPARP